MGQADAVAGTIYLVRHGETEWNREERIQGHLDSPLTPKGRHQARAAGRLLGRLIEDPAALALYASPLGRARQTADIVADALGLGAQPWRHDERLKEITWGDWDGRTHAEIEARWPGGLDRREARHWTAVPPGGESYAMLASRVESWLKSLSGHECRVLVAHGTLGRVLRGLYLGLSNVETLALDEPQNALFRLARGGVERHAYDPE